LLKKTHPMDMSIYVVNGIMFEEKKFCKDLWHSSPFSPNYDIKYSNSNASSKWVILSYILCFLQHEQTDSIG
jgi:hypothetical protein